MFIDREGSGWNLSKERVKVFSQSADSPYMRDLFYRLPRFAADFPVDVIIGEMAILGVCKNISETGMRGEFRHRLPIDTEGLIRLNHPQRSMELRGKVVNYAQYQMAFHFLFQSEQERKKLIEFARAANVVGSALKVVAPPPRGLRYLPMPMDRRRK
jgi:hypothetical protein